jgi:SAM-dependent methyltransferase
MWTDAIFARLARGYYLGEGGETQLGRLRPRTASGRAASARAAAVDGRGAPPPVGRGVYGEVTAGGMRSVLQVLGALQGDAALGPAATLLDIGSGLGRWVFAAACWAGVGAAVGVELVHAAVAEASATAAAFGLAPAVRFLHADGGAPATWLQLQEDGLAPTHVVAFDAAFSRPTLEAIAARLAACPTWRVLVSCRPPQQWAAFSRGALALTDHAKVPIAMRGSGERRTMHVLLRR